MGSYVRVCHLRPTDARRKRCIDRLFRPACRASEAEGRSPEGRHVGIGSVELDVGDGAAAEDVEQHLGGIGAEHHTAVVVPGAAEGATPVSRAVGDHSGAHVTQGELADPRQDLSERGLLVG